MLVVFGAKRLPEMGRSLGTGMRGFRDSLSGQSAQEPPIAQQAAASAHSQEPTPIAAGSPAQTPVPISVEEPGGPLAA